MEYLGGMGISNQKLGVIGRGAFIEEIWERLDEKSIYVNDLRRIGKTKVLEKMAEEGHPDWVVVHRDLEGHSTAAEFATAVYTMSGNSLGGGAKALRTMGKLLGKASGTEIPGVLKLPEGRIVPWKDVLRRTFADVAEAVEEQGKRFVFLWDEVPFMLGKIEASEGAATAMEVLDVIRELTQTHHGVRVLLTGSVGLHHVLTGLQKKGYRGTPLNHMDRMAPGPLEAGDGSRLAISLMTQFGVEPAPGSSLKGIAAGASALVGHVPFYLRGLISKLRKRQVDEAMIEAELVQQITDPDDPWDLSHYLRRLGDYYGDDEPIARSALDILAIHRKGIMFEELKNEIRAKVSSDDEQIRQVIKLLLRDHYLSKMQDGLHVFRLEVVRRWWCFERNIQSIEA